MRTSFRPPPLEDSGDDEGDMFPAPPGDNIACVGDQFPPAPPDDVGVVVPPRTGRPRPIRRTAKTRGSVGCWIVSEYVVAGASSLRRRRVEGLMVVTWRFASAGVFGPNVAREPVGGDVVEYHIDDCWSLVRSEEVDGSLDEHSALAPMQLEQACKNIELLSPEVTVEEFLSSTACEFRKVFVIHAVDVEATMAGATPRHLRTVPLALRTPVLLDMPTRWEIYRWRQVHGAPPAPGLVPRVQQALPTSEFALLELPAKRPRKGGQEEEKAGPNYSTRFGHDRVLDPISLVNAVAFSLHLRNVEQFTEAMADARCYETGDGERNAEADPHPSSLHRAASRLDIVGMNVERRIWHQEVLDESVDAINVYSDSSPVTGTELQGMVVDIVHKTGDVRRVVLPGGSLTYGNCDAVAKTMVFLWSSWLVFGPDERHLRYFCDHVYSWTTDFGVETHCVGIPDCLVVFWHGLTAARWTIVVH
jgi:hypothetical protein